MGYNITSRISIESASLDDIVDQAEALYECVDRSRNELKNLTWAATATLATTYAFLQNKIASEMETVRLILVDHEVAGVFEIRLKDGGRAEIGYWLDVKYRGLGVIDIVAKQLVNDIAAKTAVFGYCNHLNASSIRIMTDAGMKPYMVHAGLVHFMRPQEGA